MAEANDDVPYFPEAVRLLDPQRVRDVTGMLANGRRCPGRAIEDREAWQRLNRWEGFRRLPDEAAALLEEPLLVLTEDIYLDHSRTGTEEVYSHFNRTTRVRFTKLVLAECMESEGRFLEGIHESIRAVCAEPTWVHAYHDITLRNWRGEAIEIDLSSSTMGYRLAVADFFLGDRLDPDVRNLVRGEVRRRIEEPFEAMLDGAKLNINQDAPFTWLELTHNWNAVCLANVVGTVMALSGDVERQARFVAGSERYILNFLEGFGDDGACREGLNYWNFGFSHFLLLSETLWHATAGEIDLMGDERVREIAQFGARMEIMPGAYPAFADCQVEVSPITDVMRYVSRRFGLGMTQWEAAEPETTSLPFAACFGFTDPAGRGSNDTAMADELALRSWFEDAGMYVGRGATDAVEISTAFKGGNNQEPHNHNDLGSFVVALGGRILLTDPGSEHYTSRTFGPNRYESKVLNSYGHSVPRVAGTLQSAGRDIIAQVVGRGFSREEDWVQYDLRPAYDVDGLLLLTRRFSFSRKGTGRLVVQDEIRFANADRFETALITFDQWRHVSENSIEVFDKSNAISVLMRCDGGTLAISAEQIDENVRAPSRPTRIAISVEKPVTHAVVEMVIEPRS